MVTRRREKVPDLRCENPYRTAQSYLDAGWDGPIPLPAREKSNPPTGWTGGKNNWSKMTPLAVKQFLRTRGKDGSNIGLWAAPGFVGFDVDHYNKIKKTRAGNKTIERRGYDELKALEKELGPLPETWTSSARRDGKSGIRWFRCPEDLVIAGKLSDAIELIHVGYRYGVVAPSWNPDIKDYYRWYAPGKPLDGGGVFDIPDASEIPELPEEWVEHLRNGANHKRIKEKPLGPKSRAVAKIDAWLNEFAGQEMCGRVSDVVDKFAEQIEEHNPHDRLSNSIWQLLCLSQEGHRGLVAALTELEELFTEELSSDRSGHTPRGGPVGVAEEFARVRDGGVKKLMTLIDEGHFMGFPEECSCLVEPDRPTDENAPGYHAEYNSPDSYPGTDTGLAQHMVDLHRYDLAWLVDEARWICWNGTTWERTHDEAMINRAELVGNRLWEAGHKLMNGGDEEKAGRLYAMGRDALQLPRLKRIIETARSREYVSHTSQDFDNRADLLGVGNGVLELSEDGSVKLRAGERADRVTRSTAVPYVEDGDSELLEEYFDTFIPEKDLRRYLQKILGYGLMGGNPERLFMIWKGRSTSGKGVLIGSIERTLGGYAGSFDLSAFRASVGDRPRPDILAIKPKRLAFANEMDSSYPLHADQIKRITGADAIPVRRMYSDAVDETLPQFIPIISTNSVPSIPGADNALRRRLVVIPWEHELHRDDPRYVDGYGETLKSSPEFQTALLLWMVSGYTLYRKEGITDVPRGVSRAAAEFMANTSDFNAWFAETFVKDPKGEELISDIEQSYETWCNMNHVPQRDRLKSKGGLAAMLEDAGFNRIRKTVWRDGKAARVRRGFRWRKA